jgi:hypothetical protein
VIDRHDPTWVSIRRHLDEEIERWRKANDNPKLSESETAAVRARIAAIKDLLALPERLAAQASMSEPR